ncbi:YhgE/Pip domain-containing protein [Paraliobacillus zengyii]|uniref:YhgE/Pip domain-containing protein n=1 Tax=Paraliobacillus zengyii TaxID=2213194 RepID=UPI000DD3917D|nr:ABC transporter permease [Paraliobacillus zengyii]
MDIYSTFKDFFKIFQTKLGLVFAIGLPLFFTVIWMTGYDGATERIDQLTVGIVNQEGADSETIAESIETYVPFQTEQYADLTKAQEEMDDGELVMIVSIPENFINDANDGNSELTYYINQANSEIALAIAESSVAQITSSINEGVFTDTDDAIVSTNIVKTNSINNFAVTMLPMILGFVTYIGVMTMNIQFNLSSMFIQKNHTKYQIFWGRQLLLLLVSIFGSLIVTSVAMLFADTVASFWQMWGFHILVYMASISVTQMSFALFGGLGALFNTALVPLQLMTAGNIIPADMLTGFYRHLGNFLPASNAIQGYMRLIYSGASISPFIMNLLLITVVTFGISLLRLYSSELSFKQKIKAKPETT